MVNLEPKLTDYVLAEPEKTVFLEARGIVWRHGILGPGYYMTSTGLRETGKYPEEAPFTAKSSNYTNGWRHVEYREPDGDGISWTIRYHPEPTKTEWEFVTQVHGNGTPVGFTIKPKEVDYGESAPFVILTEGDYWRASGIETQTERMLGFLLDPKFNCPLPQDLLPAAVDAANKLLSKLRVEMDAVTSPNFELRCLDYNKLKANQSRVVKTN